MNQKKKNILQILINYIFLEIIYLRRNFIKNKIPLCVFVPDRVSKIPRMQCESF